VTCLGKEENSRKAEPFRRKLGKCPVLSHNVSRCRDTINWSNSKSTAHYIVRYSENPEKSQPDFFHM